MAITFIKERKKQRYLALITLVVIGVTLLVLWLGVFREKEPSLSPVPVTPYREIKISFDILEHSFWKEGQPFKEILPFKDGMGRTNPFLPY